MCRASWSCKTVSRFGTRAHSSERGGTDTSFCLNSHWSSARSSKTQWAEPSTSTNTDYWWVWSASCAYIRRMTKTSATVGVSLHCRNRTFVVTSHSWFVLQTSELGVTEHIEGDPCKFALWAGRTPSSDNKTVLKASRGKYTLWIVNHTLSQCSGSHAGVQCRS